MCHLAPTVAAAAAGASAPTATATAKDKVGATQPCVSFDCATTMRGVGCCGQRCERPLPCNHTCPRECHWGPCEQADLPPSTAVAATAGAGSGADESPTDSPADAPPSPTRAKPKRARRICRAVCGRELACGHACVGTCHYPTPCNARCDAAIEVPCVCGASRAAVPCSRQASLAARSSDGVARVPCHPECKWKANVLVVDAADIAELQLAGALRDAAAARAAAGKAGKGASSSAKAKEKDPAGGGPRDDDSDDADGGLPPPALHAAIDACFGAAATAAAMGAAAVALLVAGGKTKSRAGRGAAAAAAAANRGTHMALEAIGGAALPLRHVVDIVCAFGSLQRAERCAGSLSAGSGEWPAHYQQIALCRDGSSFMHLQPTFTIREGSRSALVGPAGCGKSLLLRTLFLGIAPLKHFNDDEVALVSSDPITDPRVGALTTVDFLAGIVDPTSTKGDACDEASVRSRARRLIEVFPGLPSDVAERPVSTLSHGQMTVVKFLRALVRGASIIFVDGAFAGLDPSISAVLRSVLDSRNGVLPSRVSVVMVGTDSTLRSVATSIAYVDSGSVHFYPGDADAFDDWWLHHLRQQRNASQAAARRESELRRQIVAARKAAKRAASHRGQRAASGLLRSRKNVLNRLQWLMAFYSMRGVTASGGCDMRIPTPDKLHQPAGTPVVGQVDLQADTVAISASGVAAARVATVAIDEPRKAGAVETTTPVVTLQGSLTLRVGDRVLVCGANGSGKSSLLEAMAAALRKAHLVGSPPSLSASDVVDAPTATTTTPVTSSPPSPDTFDDRAFPPVPVSIASRVTAQSPMSLTEATAPRVSAVGCVYFAAADRAALAAADASTNVGSFAIVGVTTAPAASVAVCTSDSLSIFGQMTCRDVLIAVNKDLFGGHTTVAYQYLASLGIPKDFADRPVDVLSAAEGARLTVALALAARPTMIILDDPFVGVDVEVTQSLLTMLSQQFSGIVVVAVASPEKAVGFEPTALWYCDGGVAEIVDGSALDV